MKTKDLLRLTLALVFAVLLAACGDDNNTDPDTPGEEETGLPKLVKTDKRLRFVKTLVSRDTECDWTDRFDYDADGYLKYIYGSNEDGDCSVLDYYWSDGKMFARRGFLYESGFRYRYHGYTFKNSRVRSTFWESDTCQYEYSIAGNLVKVHSIRCGLDIRISYNGGRIAKITRTRRNDIESVDEEWTYSYNGTEGNGMCYNVYVNAVTDDYALPDADVFFVHPELIGLRNRYLPSSVHIKKKEKDRREQKNTTCDITYRWVVDKDKRLEKGYMQQTKTSEWEYYDELPSQSNVVKKNVRAKTTNKDVSNYAEEYEFVWE